MSVVSQHRRKASRPRQLLRVLNTAVAFNVDVVEDQPPPTQHQQHQSAVRLEAILSEVALLAADMVQERHKHEPDGCLSDSQASAPGPESESLAKVALDHVTTARFRLLEALCCLRRSDEADNHHVAMETSITAAETSSDVTASVSETENVFHTSGAPATKTVEKDRRPACNGEAACKKRWNKDFVNESFVPSISTDGSDRVTLSNEHPAATVPVGVYHRLLDESRGAATLHLRALLKHFFSRDTLAESSVTGAGTYKRPLDKEIVLGVCDYIHNRYPGAMSESRMRLCCTDVCVQARRRRRAGGHRASSSVSGAAAAPPAAALPLPVAAGEDAADSVGTGSSAEHDDSVDM